MRERQIEMFPIRSKLDSLAIWFSVMRYPANAVASAEANERRDKRMAIKAPLSLIEGDWVKRVITGINLKFIMTINPVEIIRSELSFMFSI